MGADGRTTDVHAESDRPRMTARTWLQVVWYVGRIIASFTSLLSASMVLALEVSYRTMAALVDWRPFPMSVEVTIALFLVLFFSLFAGLEWLAYRYTISLGERMLRKIRVAQAPNSPDPDASIPPVPDPHFDQEPAR